MKSTRQMIITGMFAAVIAVLAQIAIPLPSGVPITLQTFAVALTGAVLGAKYGTAATAVYILLGAVGVPVFTGFMGGLGVIVGKTGGFIWGFLPLTFFTGLGIGFSRKMMGWLMALVGLAACHMLGTLQFSILTGMDFMGAALLVSVPYLVKDICSVILACILGVKIRGQLYRGAFIKKTNA